MGMVEPSTWGVSSSPYEPTPVQSREETAAERSCRKLREIEEMCVKHRSQNDSLGWVISAVAWLLADRIDQLKREADVSNK